MHNDLTRISLVIAPDSRYDLLQRRPRCTRGRTDVRGARLL